MLLRDSIPPVLALALSLSCGEGPEAPGEPSSSFTVVATGPVNGKTGVARALSISVRFSDAVDPATVHAGSFALRREATQLAGDITVDGAIATLQPKVALEFATTYTATVTTQVHDTAGNRLRSGHMWMFRTKENRVR